MTYANHAVPSISGHDGHLELPYRNLMVFVTHLTRVLTIQGIAEMFRASRLSFKSLLNFLNPLLNFLNLLFCNARAGLHNSYGERIRSVKNVLQIISK